MEVLPVTFYDRSIFNVVPKFAKNESYDVQITMGCLKISSHKEVLSRASQYFKALFASDLTPSNISNVDLSDFDEACLKEMVDYLYHGQITFNQDNIYHMVELQDFLGIFNIRPLLINYLLSTVNTKNCWSYHSIAGRHNYFEVYNKVDLYIRENFENLIREDNNDFLTILPDELLSFFEGDFLFIENHEKLMFHLCYWLAYDPSTRLKFMTDLLSHVDLTRIVSWQNMDQRLALLFSVESHKNEVKQWAMKAEEMRKTATRRPKKSKVVEVLLQLGGTVSDSVDRYKTRHVAFVDCIIPPDIRKKVLPLTSDYLESTVIPPMNKTRCRGTTVSTGTSVYIFGGTENAEGKIECEVYRLKDNAWFDLPSLSVSPEKFRERDRNTFACSFPVISACFANGKIFAYVVPFLFELSKTETDWIQVPIESDFRIHAMVGANGSVYCIGKDETKHGLCYILKRFDPVSHTWVLIFNIPTCGYCCSAVCIENEPCFKDDSRNCWMRYNLCSGKLLCTVPRIENEASYGTICLYKGKQMVLHVTSKSLQFQQIRNDKYEVIGEFLLTDRSYGALATLLVPVYSKEPI